MPAERELVDVETLLVPYLLADDALAALVEDRVWSPKLDSGFQAGDEAALRFFRVGASDVDPESGHVERALVAAHCFGADEIEAFDVARKTLSALRRTVTTTFDGAVFTKAQRVIGPTWSPDPDTKAPRYLLDVMLTVHPTAG